AERDRLRVENSYLLSRLVEMETRLKLNLDKLTATLDRLSNLVVPANLPRFLSPEQIADVLGVKGSAIYSWISDGKIPYRRVGKLPRFVLEDVMAWSIPANGKRATGGKKRPGVVRLPGQS